MNDMSKEVKKKHTTLNTFINEELRKKAKYEGRSSMDVASDGSPTKAGASKRSLKTGK